MTPDDLVVIEQIKRLKYRYLRCLDQKRWDELGETLTEDCEASYGGGAHELVSRDAIVAFLREVLGDESMLSSHRCHHPEIDLVAPDEAHGVWAMDDVVVMVELGFTVRGAAYYTDTYRRVGGRWRIARTAYRRMYEELEPRGAIEGLRLTASWWGTDGRSSL